MTIDIIGAGIGGLTTAIALEKKGFNVRVFEQAETLKPLGAGIILANNAMQVFEHLGLRKAIEKEGNPISSMKITHPNLSPLSKVDLTFFEKKHLVKNIAIHRGQLQTILMNALERTEVYLHHKTKGIAPLENGYQITFENGKRIQSQLIIGADGIHSSIRTQLFPESKTRQAKQICWRGVTDFKLSTRYQHELNEAWSTSSRFGFVQIAENKVYWYALKSYNKDGIAPQFDDFKKNLSNYHPIVKEIIGATSTDQINTAEIADLAPINQWYKENVCLIGDAAHATTPNMGQGACQAIEDAYVLSECMEHFEANEAFQHFQQLRLSKAKKVVNTSWMIGKISHFSHPLLILLRNFMMKITASFNRKQTAYIFQIPSV
ncbi:FAD-dependent monooxygenase [Flammeovirga agarivorans]|uniref:NAD(P)-binding protein n=1 Tax=Flammeovirga agarivorans TaxID=2726742 RepID=A0A7X8SP21_9BACT|nr:FAD-dependent monooxygenase [Flammeovirga agarivorans]NLR93780.1 NAD(P)-binding protein [Flammeovirga agarivorans]